MTFLTLSFCFQFVRSKSTDRACFGVSLLSECPMSISCYYLRSSFSPLATGRNPAHPLYKSDGWMLMAQHVFKELCNARTRSRASKWDGTTPGDFSHYLTFLFECSWTVHTAHPTVLTVDLNVGLIWKSVFMTAVLFWCSDKTPWPRTTQRRKRFVLASCSRESIWVSLPQLSPFSHEIPHKAGQLLHIFSSTSAAECSRSSWKWHDCEPERLEKTGQRWDRSGSRCFRGPRLLVLG